MPELFSKIYKIGEWIKHSDYECLVTNFFQNIVVLTPNKITANAMIDGIRVEFGHDFNIMKFTDSRFIIWSKEEKEK